MNNILSTINSEMIRFVALFDIHYPDNISLSPVEMFLKDFKPHILVYGGDTWGCNPLSHWGEQNRFKEIGFQSIRKQLSNEAQGVHNLIKKHIELSNASIILYFIGNHEDWIRQYQATYGNASEPLTLDSLTKISSLGVKIIPTGKVVKLGKMGIVHGDKISKGGNQGIARIAVTWYENTILFGHYHQSQSFSKISPLEVQSPHMGQCVGCLTNNNPEYNENKPNACVHQFACGYISKRNGYFNYYLPTIIRGKFMWNNKEYV